MRHLQRLPVRSFAAAGVIASLVTVFLALAEGNPARSHLSSAGWLQGFPLTRIDPPARSFGVAGAHAAARTEPWMLFEEAEIATGNAPLWNPWNAAGRPHAASPGSAAFSPLSLPIHLLGPRQGPWASAALGLFVLGFLSFLFLRQLRTGILAALVGATVFAFAGAQLGALESHRAGALAVLPAVLLFAEKALARVQAVALGTAGEQRQTARVRAPLAGLCIALAAGSAAGEPGALVGAVLILAVWVAARLLAIGLQTRQTGRALRPLADFAAKMAIAAILAAGISAFRILPWIEMLRHGTPVPSLATRSTPLEWGPWPLLFFPRALGEPGSSGELGAYLGGFALFLVVFSLAFTRRDPRISVLLALGVLSIAAASGAVPRFDAGFGVPLQEQGQGAFAFCMACAGALGIERLANRKETPSWGRAAITAIGGLAFLALFRLGAERFAPDPAAAPHLRRMAEAFAVGLVALCLAWVAPAGRMRALAGAGLVLSVFLGNGLEIADLLPRCEERAFFPSTVDLQRLQKRIGRDRLVILGEEALPPEANLPYRIAVLTSRDGLVADAFARLYRESFGGSALSGPIQAISGRSLQIFGVSWVLAGDAASLLRKHPGTFELVDRLGELGLHRCMQSSGKAWLVRGSTPARTLEEAFDRVRAPAFDPMRSVVLGPDEETEVEELPPGTGDILPTVVAETPTWIRIEANCDTPGFLVLAQTHDPGWKARVNGVERRLRRANYAFSAVELQRGLNVVDLSYEPETLRIGLWIGLGCALAGLLCLFHRATA